MDIPRPLRLLYLEWDDAASRSVWMTADDLREYANSQWLNRQCGFLLEETAAHLLIAGSWAPEDDWHVEKFGDVTRIPKTWIKTRRVLATVSDSGTLRFRNIPTRK